MESPSETRIACGIVTGVGGDADNYTPKEVGHHVAATSTRSRTTDPVQKNCATSVYKPEEYAAPSFVNVAKAGSE
jgi:hypothetical protein